MLTNEVRTSCDGSNLVVSLVVLTILGSSNFLSRVAHVSSTMLKFIAIIKHCTFAYNVHAYVYKYEPGILCRYCQMYEGERNLWRASAPPKINEFRAKRRTWVYRNIENNGDREEQAEKVKGKGRMREPKRERERGRDSLKSEREWEQNIICEGKISSHWGSLYDGHRVMRVDQT